LRNKFLLRTNKIEEGDKNMASAPTPTPAASTGMGNNVAGLLCYLFGWLGGLIFLLIDPYKTNRFVRFCAFQSIFLDVAIIALIIGLSILGFLLAAVTRGFGGLLMLALWPLLWLAFLGTKIFLMIKAYGNQEFKLPVIGELAAKQAGS
jgi:uncharacterized membrane protein